MAEPNLGFFDLLNIVLPYLVAVVVGIVAIILFTYYKYKYMPEIARRFTKAFHSRGLPLFLQDEMGNVDLHICDKKFPEGVVHVKGKGWFLLPNPPNPINTEGLVEAPHYGPGRPPLTRKPIAELTKEELDQYAIAYGILVQTPILRGFGRQVFFGSTVSAAISNLKAIAHADLPSVRKLSPKMYQKTQLDALATGSRLEGIHMANKEVTKLLLYVIIAAVPIAVVGLIVYLLTQNHGTAAFLLGII